MAPALVSMAQQTGGKLIHCDGAAVYPAALFSKVSARRLLQSVETKEKTGEKVIAAWGEPPAQTAEHGRCAFKISSSQSFHRTAEAQCKLSVECSIRVVVAEQEDDARRRRGGSQRILKGA